MRYRKNDIKLQLKQQDSDMAKYRTDSLHIKRQNLLVKSIQKINKVVGQCYLPQTILADDGNRNIYVSSWMLSACGRQIAHLTRSTTKMLPPQDCRVMTNA